MAKVRAMQGRTGRAVANQYIITGGNSITFQSYDSIIAVIKYNHPCKTYFINADKYDYSKTTMKYLCEFLNVMSIETVRRAIKSGEIIAISDEKMERGDF